MTTLDTRQMAALEQAAHWFSVLQCETASPADHSAWQQWLHSCDDNRWAWELAQRLQQQLHGMPGPLAGRAMRLADRPGHASRRTLLKGLALAMGSGLLGYGGYRQGQQAGWMADYRTATGERRTVRLADGSQLQLNTHSAVDVLYDASQRRLILRGGEVLISTAADSAKRPFLLQTPQGTVQALGTRFSVRLDGNQVRVAVFEHQVRVTPLDGKPQLLETGTQCTFDNRQVGVASPLQNGQGAWQQGRLVANNQRLDAFLAELGRYRQGWLRCDPAVAGLRISGAFALDDTDQALQALSTSLPVRVERYSRFWVSVIPA
jgi:transmembrane sensor